jgi:hypothetical protein
LAAKSKRAPHCEQNPDERPAWPFFPRPTGLSQRVQKRRPSGTLGSAMTTVAGSTVAMGAMSTTPAPIRLRRLVVPVLPDCRLRVVSRDTSTRPDTRPDGVTTPLWPRRAVEADVCLAGASPQVSQ